jgi:LmbE family N-acetylglucosaminyl deacetylase
VNLALPDGGLNGMDAAQVGRLVEVIRQWRPRFVVAPWSVERHPDHEQAHALVRRAVFMAGLAKFGDGAPLRVKEVLWYPMRFEAQPRIVVDISTVMETKYAAIACHGSQVAPTVTAEDGQAVATLVGSARNLEVLRARDAYWGGVAGSQAAEPYVTDRVPVTTDPALCFGGSGGDGDVYVFAAGSRGEA